MRRYTKRTLLTIVLILLLLATLEILFAYGTAQASIDTADVII